MTIFDILMKNDGKLPLKTHTWLTILPSQMLNSEKIKIGVGGNKLRKSTSLLFLTEI
jgi:hypothetical protein